MSYLVLGASRASTFLSYGLFPFLLWMFWRMEGLLQRVQRKSPIILISGFTPIHRYWQMGLALFALILGGNAIFGFFLLARISVLESISAVLHRYLVKLIASCLI